MKNLLKNIVITIVVLLVVVSVFQYATYGKPEPEEIEVGTLVEEIRADQVEEVVVEGTKLTVLRLDENLDDDIEVVPQVLYKEPGEKLSDLLSNYGVTAEELLKFKTTIKGESGARYWMGMILPFALPLLLFIVLIMFFARSVSGANSRAMSFGQSTAKEQKKDEKTKETFADVAGMKEAKEELEEIVDFLKNPKQFTDMGAKIPKGVLMMGKPGTGKTLLSKAVAGEANVPFFHISGSEFVEMFVGVGASRVRDLFQKAKKAAPAIVFIDEIDAVGRRRGAGLGGSHDEREQTLNQILVEMDGFDPNLGVIVIAATNRPDVLDPALLRPGRFDRRVTINPPDIEDREEILKIHAKNKPLAKDVDLRVVAERTPGFTGADLASLMNEAAILTVRRNKKIIGMTEVLESIEKVLLGPERKSHVLSKEEKKMTAYHEAGHAVVGFFSEHADPVRKVSVISRGHAGGYTLKMPTTDKHFKTKAEFYDDVAVALGGYVAEKMIFGEENISTGPSSDLRSATQMAKSIVMDYGMSDKLGQRTYGEREDMIFLGKEIHEQRDYSEATASEIDREVQAVIEAGRKQAEKLLDENKDKMEALVERLMEKESVEQAEFEALMKGEKVETSNQIK